MTYNYYYGSQAEQFSFVRIPRMMLTDKAFQSLSITAKVLYGVLLDRMSLSMKKQWNDHVTKKDEVYGSWTRLFILFGQVLINGRKI